MSPTRISLEKEGKTGEMGWRIVWPAEIVENAVMSKCEQSLNFYFEQMKFHIQLNSFPQFDDPLNYVL